MVKGVAERTAQHTVRACARHLDANPFEKGTNALLRRPAEKVPGSGLKAPAGEALTCSSNFDQKVIDEVKVVAPALLRNRRARAWRLACFAPIHKLNRHTRATFNRTKANTRKGKIRKRNKKEQTWPSCDKRFHSRQNRHARAGDTRITTHSENRKQYETAIAPNTPPAGRALFHEEGLASLRPANLGERISRISSLPSHTRTIWPLAPATSQARGRTWAHQPAGDQRTSIAILRQTPPQPKGQTHPRWRHAHHHKQREPQTV